MNNKSLSVTLATGLLLFASCKVRSNDAELSESREGGLEGVTAAIRNEFVTFSTKDTDYRFDIKQVNAATATKLRESLAKRLRVTVNLPAKITKSGTKTALNIRPDCGEQPISYDELIGIADRSKDIVTFLKNLKPTTSLQTFTFVHKSQSPLKDEVSETFPRVLRMSADAKLLVAYSCNPKGPHFNHAEVMRFDDATSEFKFSEINFAAKPSQKVSENPSECQQCHVPSFRDVDPRPNWQMYFTWDGVFGINDDQLGGSIPGYINGKIGPEYRFSVNNQKLERPAELKDEIKSFEKFRKTQADNPCYDLLPWPNKKAPPTYAQYPYSQAYKDSNYHLRPNLKLTEGMAHLMGKRLARKFLERPKFRPLRYIAAMEALQCPIDAKMEKTIKSLLPSYKIAIPKVTGADDEFQKMLFYFDPRMPEGGGQRLYAIGKALGFSDADWTMSFNRPADPVYNTGLSVDNFIVPLVADVSILRVTQSQLVESLSKDIKGLKETYGMTRGEGQNFGEFFQCVDDLGGQLYPLDQPKFCSLLTKAMTANAKTDLEASTAKYSPRKRAGIAQGDDARQLVMDAKLLDKDLIKEGKQIAADTCGGCHADSSVPPKLQFFKSETELAKQLTTRSGNVEFIMKAFARIDSETKPMPPKDFSELAEQDRDAVATYLNSLYLKAN